MVTRADADRGSAYALRTRALDAKQLKLSSLSSVLGGIVGAALGGGMAMTLVGMAVTPWLTAFVEYPGPHRRRRVALVVLLAAVVCALRWLRDHGGVSQLLEQRRHPGPRRPRPSRPFSLGVVPA
jgi:hypothetical protein